MWPKPKTEGLLKRITAEVDWNLELSHIAKLNEEKSGPALLFENVKDYKTPVITSVCTTTERLALIMGQPLDSTLVDLYVAWAKLGEHLVPPKEVDKSAGAVQGKHPHGRRYRSLQVPGSQILPPGRRTLLSVRPTSSSARTPKPAGSTWGPTGASSWGKTRSAPSSSRESTPTSCSRNTRPWESPCRWPP